MENVTTYRVVMLLIVLFIQSESSQGVITVRVPPVSRVVSANGFAFFECNTTAQHNSWRVDGKAVVSDHQYILGYQTYRISINVSLQDFPVNLTWPSILTCVADGYQSGSPNVYVTATLTILKDPPVSPNPTYRFINSSTIVVTWSPPFLWSDYGQLIYEEYHVGFTENTSVGRVVDNRTVSATTNDSLVQLEYTFSESFRESRCSEIIVELFATSQERGNTQPITFNALLPTASAGEFDSLAIQSIVYFQPNGSPAVFLTFELPFVCPFQKIEYTVTLRDSNNENEVFQVGPQEHAGPGNITEKITSELLSGKNYSAQITAISVSGSSTSPIHSFSTSSSFDCTRPTDSNVTMNSNSTDIKLIVAIAALSALTIVQGLGLIVISACCIWKKRPQRSKPRIMTLQSMVNNPIYDGPLYETVQQEYTPTNSPTPDTARERLSSPSQCDSPVRYSNGPSNIVPNPNPPPMSFDQSAPRGISQLALSSFRSASVSENRTCNPPAARREHNKLCLTLSLSNSQPPHSEHPHIEAKRAEKNAPGVPTRVNIDPLVPCPVDESYIVMSPVGKRRFGSSLNGGWGE